VLGRDGKVVGLECLKTMRVFDENHRFSPVFYENSETQFECDTIILSIGQAPNLDFLFPDDGIQVSPRGLVNVHRETLMTSAPGVFAGGDCAFGPRLIIDSVGDGKRAAVGIDEYIRGTKHPEPQIEVHVLDRWQMAVDYMNLKRQAIPMLPLDRRTGMTEVELVYTEQEAMAEAQRCLKCYVNTILEGSEADGTDCVLCGGCVDVCPENCLDNPERFGFELENIQPSELGSITGTAMLKDETRCIRCGLCALRCPANTITMEAYHFVASEPTGLITIQSFDGPKASDPGPKA
jgi:ferredoxin